MPHIPSLGYSQCEVIRFRSFVFYPDKPIQVQITINHIDTRDMNYVHDAAVSWIEDVTYQQFTACVMAAGYNERKSLANVSIDWIAYQGAPEGGVTGEVRMSQWWTGTSCKTVNFPSVSDYFHVFYILLLLLFSLSFGFFIWMPVSFPCDIVITTGARSDIINILKYIIDSEHLWHHLTGRKVWKDVVQMGIGQKRK